MISAGQLDAGIKEAFYKKTVLKLRAVFCIINLRVPGKGNDGRIFRKIKKCPVPPQAAAGTQAVHKGQTRQIPPGPGGSRDFSRNQPVICRCIMEKIGKRSCARYRLGQHSSKAGAGGRKQQRNRFSCAPG